LEFLHQDEIRILCSYHTVTDKWVSHYTVRMRTAEDADPNGLNPAQRSSSLQKNQQHFPIFPLTPSWNCEFSSLAPLPPPLIWPPRLGPPPQVRRGTPDDGLRRGHGKRRRRRRRGGARSGAEGARGRWRRLPIPSVVPIHYPVGPRAHRRRRALRREGG
jgi:hypothetical protein